MERLTQHVVRRGLRAVLRQELGVGGGFVWNREIGVCVAFFFFNDTATTEIYTLSLHDALPIYFDHAGGAAELKERLGVEIVGPHDADRFLLNELERSEEHTSELQSRETISYAVFCLKKKKKQKPMNHYTTTH